MFVCLLAACASAPGNQVAETDLPAAEVTLRATTSATPTPKPSPTTSPTPQNAPDLSAETMVLPYLCDRSGPFSAAHASRLQALEDLVEAINEGGGIFGAALDLRLADTAGTADGARRGLARLIREHGEGPLVLICDAAAEGGIGEMLNEDEIPALGPGVFAEPAGYLFGLDAIPQQHLSSFLQDLLDHWSQWRPDGAPDEIKLAIIAWPQDLAGDLAGAEVLQDMEAAQIEIVMQADLPAVPDVNIFDLIYQARDLNANVIYTKARGFGLAALLNALQDLGLRQRFVVAAPALALDAQTYEYLQDPSYAEGLLLTSAWAWWSEVEVAGNQDLLDLHPQAEDQDWGYLQMAGAISLARRAFEEAILSEGFENLSPETVFAALEDMKDFPALGGLFVVDYSSGQRSLGELRTWRVGADMWMLDLAE